jgi:8-oxo-dGTP pyrophosphatase MutT (NUDIX family)
VAKLKSCGFLIYRDNQTFEVDQDTDRSTKADLPAGEKNGISFLLLKHPNRWDLPKGHVDDGETNKQCAFRELVEETGIRKQDLQVDPDFKYKHKYLVNYKRTGGKPRKKKLIIYLAKLIKPVKLKLTEHEGHRWFDWNPPHSIQEKTIDPLLQQLHQHWQTVSVEE